MECIVLLFDINVVIQQSILRPTLISHIKELGIGYISDWINQIKFTQFR